MTYYGIYKITNMLNGMMYIGKHKTSNIDDGYMGSGIIISRAVRKHGKNNFRKEWLMFCEDEEEMNYMERVYVDQTWVDRSDTYNMTLGGVGGAPKGRNKGMHHTEETKKKISAASKGTNNPMYGKPCYFKMTEKQKADWCRKCSRPGKMNGRYGKPTSNKTKELISKAQKGYHWYNNGIIQTKAAVCPEGFMNGRLKNNKKLNKENKNESLYTNI